MSLNRRRFLQTTSVSLAASATLPLAQAAPKEAKVPLPEQVGPVLGHIDAQHAHLFFRPAKPGLVKWELRDEAGKIAATQTEEAHADHDLCVHFAMHDLQPGKLYRGRIVEQPGGEGTKSKPPAEVEFRTPELPETPARVCLGMGSCVASTDFDPLWKRIASEQVEGFCLLGDTPYIDKTDLTANRHARRTFWGTLPSLGELATRVPFWNTWDDHDFGKNDSDGRIKGKQEIRRAFLEYNALASYGEENAGIYTSFRRGPLEVWLIDDRWFSQTEQSWADSAKPTCLGAAQWAWLQRTLKASTAPFKLLCAGMVWYPKGNKEKDHWETYAAEREAIFAYIKSERIPGVMLISGDIHVSRHHDYGKERLGYPLHECVVSPLHAKVIPALDVKHEARVWSKPEPNVFLKVEAENFSKDPQLTATWINMAGKQLHRVEVSATQLNAA